MHKKVFLNVSLYHIYYVILSLIARRADCCCWCVEITIDIFFAPVSGTNKTGCHHKGERMIKKILR